MSTQVSISGLVQVELYQSLLNRLANHTHSFSHFNSREIGFDRGPLETISEDSNLLTLKHTIRTPGIIENDSPINYKNPIRNGWSLISLGRIEPERLSPEFSIRPIHFCPIIAGNPIEFVSALGYRRTFEYFRRGVQFVRGGVIIEIFRVYHSEDDEKPMAGADLHLITVTAIIPSAVRVSNPTNPTGTAAGTTGTTTTGTTGTTTTTTNTTNPTAAATTTTTTTTTTSSSSANSGPTVQELRNEACARVREIQAILKGLADLGRVEPF
ncbi:hypothetical protein PGT21_032356 [Puccinia graminis f. sp. tritici]|uniref:Mediator of RNA polymerase II transcription subunit 18 n=1 Tax=Puccinia graminis f. sp. tritici TaxID=56615 RepID=A0A5B0PMD1_PUCGR|nr:hypothetical protein PGT21_032356 [Puccinia graminis f. sp. tritici]